MSKSHNIAWLIDAHYKRDEFRFRQQAMQLIGSEKNERTKSFMASVLPKQLVELPHDCRSLVTQVKPLPLNDLVLSSDVQSEILEIARELKHREALDKRGIPVRSRLLFTGPPGTGKTSAAAVIAELHGADAYTVSLANLVESHLGDTGRNLSKLFNVLNAGAVLVLDEVDAIGSHRGGGEGSASTEMSRVVSTLLTLLDQVRGGVLVATTNRIDMLDRALLRRFDLTLEFSNPTRAQAESLIGKLDTKYSITSNALDGFTEGENYDSLTKRVVAVARRLALSELEAAE